MRWLRRRLGSSGPGRELVMGRVRGCLPEPSGPPPALGIAGPELPALLGPRWRELAAELPSRGDEERLQLIAWWGSAIGELAALGRPAERSAILREAALFNLAVALFDSAVDDAPRAVPALAQALAPQRMGARLAAPDRPEAALRCAEPGLQPLVALFDEVLAGAGRRWASSPAQRDWLCGLLRRMYESELRLARDPFTAKALPAVLVGALGFDEADEAASRLFRELGRFFWLWDDWLDQADDLLRRRPNGLWSAGRAPLCAGALARLLRGPRDHPALAEAVAQPLEAALAAASSVGPSAGAVTAALCRELVS